jgi:cell division protein ZipA
MDKDVFRLIIVSIGLLVMAAIYFFDPGRRQQAQGQKPWHDHDDVYSDDSEVMEYVRGNQLADNNDSEQSQNNQEDQEFQNNESFKTSSIPTQNSIVADAIRSPEQELMNELDSADAYDDEDSQLLLDARDSDFLTPFSNEFSDKIDSDFEISESLLLPRSDPDPDATDDVETNERPTIVMLYLVNKDGVHYQGKAISDAFAKAGLRYGSMDIFYAMDFQSNKELFSVANMHEPGTFPEQMTYFETEGMILFMQPMAIDNPLEVYDKMVACADMLFVELGGEILDDKRQPVTQAYLDQQRQWLTLSS